MNYSSTTTGGCKYCTMNKVIPIKSAVSAPAQNTETVSDVGNSKDWAMVKTMESLARSRPQKNITPVKIEHSPTRKTKLALLLLPEWGVYFPPYNQARLSSVARSAGFATTVFDVNVDAWRRLKDVLVYDPWDPAREWCWQGPTYMKEIHPHLAPILLEYVDKLVADAPDVIGFTLYYTNEQATNWLVTQLRKRLPGAKIIAGGPQASSLMKMSEKFYDHIIIGEGEQLLVDVLEKVDTGEPINEKYLVQPKTIRLDLDTLPFPDYSDYNFEDYQIPNGASSELSRGCVAKCVFCTEVHFWKYRGRMSGSVLDEVEHQHKNHGVNYIWFIDSLVNGNLKELRAFARGVVDRNLKIEWQGYSRCDGRMDYEYLKDLRASGCNLLNYGVESGSQRVLDVMKKAIKIDEIEQNLRDGHQLGILNSTQWIIGFPGEQPQDIADTFNLVWRIKNYVLNLAPGITMMMSPGAEVTDHGDQFGVDTKLYQNAWATTDLTNTKTHRLVRQKSFNIFLEHLNAKRELYGFDRPKLKETYSLSYDIDKMKDQMPNEVFDYNIIQPNINPVADTLVNEIWPLLRTLWRAFGPYRIEVKFDPESDAREFGFRIASDYTATHKFKIDNVGNWSADFEFRYRQTPDSNWGDMSFDLHWRGNGTWVN